MRAPERASRCVRDGRDQRREGTVALRPTAVWATGVSEEGTVGRRGVPGPRAVHPPKPASPRCAEWTSLPGGAECPTSDSKSREWKNTRNGVTNDEADRQGAKGQKEEKNGERGGYTVGATTQTPSCALRISLATVISHAVRSQRCTAPSRDDGGTCKLEQLSRRGCQRGVSTAGVAGTVALLSSRKRN